MRVLTASVLLLVATFATGCASTSTCGACQNAQSLVASVAAQNPECTRLSLHCSMEGGAKCCASTDAARVGRPSDKEDTGAMQSGQPIVLDEGGAFDVTVPIRAQAGKHMSACGVTLKGAGMTREQALAKATAIAKAVEAGVKDCGDCCCK